MKKILVLFFMLFISISFFSINIQNHPFNNLVSQLNINQIYQDHYDFLWLGTDYGIYRYDGQNIKSYFPSTKDTNSIKGKYINHIFEDSSKNLWFATNLGLNLFNYSKDTFEFFNIDKQILSLIEYNDDLFIGTSKGLVSFNKADNSFETISENLEEFSINDIEIHEEFVFLSTNQGLIKYLPRENNIEIYSKNQKVKKAISINNNLWYITDKGLHQYDFKNSEIIDYLDVYDFNSFTINKQELWLSTNSKKIIKFNINSKNYEVLDFSFPINYVYKDTYDFIWISNEEHGLSRININSPFENITLSSKDKLTSITIDDDSFIWISTDKGILKRFNPFSSSWENIETNLNNIRSLTNFSNYLLLGSNNGLYSFDKKDFSINEISNKNLSISIILENSNDEFFIGSNKGLYVLKDNSLNNLIENINIKKLVKDKESLWIIDNNNELIKYDITEGNKTTYEELFKENVILNNLVKINDKLYFSSDYGIIEFDLESDEMIYLNIDKGLVSNNVKSITKDQYGNIWASTDKGISKYFVFEDRFLNFDLDDGVRFKDFLDGAYFNYENKIYFLSSNGITNFYINEVKTNIKFHPVIINNINTENQKYYLDSSKKLNIKDNSFQIEFLSVDFKDEIKYRYKLIGFDDEWKYTNQNSIQFSMLPQGQYKFMIQAVDNSGKWLGEEKVINLEVSYSIFKTRYAFAFYIISILSFFSIFIYFMFLKQKTKYENKSKQLIRQHIEESQENSKHLEKLNKRVEKLSSYDPLTGIQNLRLFDEIIEREWNLAKRKKYPVTLVLIDLDYFKNYNDEYGHLKGDEVLVDVAQSLKKCLRRATDHIFRYSGEKFAAVLPDTDEPGAKVVAKNMKDAVDKLKIPHIKSEASDHITVSIGASTRTPSDYLDIDTFVSETENALIEAKNKGRNTIIQNKDKKQGDS